jgi:hypothetical protein
VSQSVAGLTQVLADGDYSYLYGQGRIAQFDGADFDYFLGDALGSVRQLADETGRWWAARNWRNTSPRRCSTNSPRREPAQGRWQRPGRRI